jgi:hypothetical protein
VHPVYDTASASLQQLLWLHWLQVIPETVPSDPWHMSRPLPLRLNNEADVYGNRTEIIEKNWMPFVYNNELYITYHVVPQHMVCFCRRCCMHQHSKRAYARRTQGWVDVHAVPHSVSDS